MKLRLAALAILASLALCACTNASAGTAIISATPTAASPAATHVADPRLEDGDAHLAACDTGAEVLATNPDVQDEPGDSYGSIELVWSPVCQAVFGRFVPSVDNGGLSVIVYMRTSVRGQLMFVGDSLWMTGTPVYSDAFAVEGITARRECVMARASISRTRTGAERENTTACVIPPIAV